MKPTQKTAAFCFIVMMSCAYITAMNTETEFDFLYTYEYDLSSENWFYVIPKFVTKYTVILMNKTENTKSAEARYIITPFSSTAELKKAHEWFNKDKKIYNNFLPLIIENIKKEYPHITRLEYVDKNQLISWNIT